MGLDDMFSTESAFVAAATAAVFSPKTRETIRRGAVYGVAGAIKAGDVVAGAARGVTRGIRGEQARSTSSNGSSGARASGARRSSPSRSRSGRSRTRSTRSTGSSSST